jgi:3-oxoacyl-(acyl-carrier-protein) synthase
MRESDVIIAGCGAVSAVGCGIEPLRSALQKNLSGLHPSEKFNSSRFQSNIVGTAPENKSDGDNPAWNLATAALQQARGYAGIILTEIPAGRIGLVLSTTKANIEALERISKNRPCSETARRHLQANFLAADLAAAHGARGPVQTVSVACVSGLIAIQQGAKIIQRGEADAVLVVGVDCLSEFVMAGFTALKALDPLGCRPFDATRCGLSPGEAGAAIVLVRADFLSQPAIAVRGFGSSNDANHLTGPSRDGSGLAQAIRTALNSAKLQPGEIDFVHAHGTGTGYNDAMESLALRTIFGEACPPVSGSKGMLGHTLGAAGVIESICCVLAMQGNFLPGTPRLNVAAEGTPKNLMREPRSDAQTKNVLKLNTGFGGVNGALILSHE